jgi:hypothetical protein
VGSGVPDTSRTLSLERSLRSVPGRFTVLGPGIDLGNLAERPQISLRFSALAGALLVGVAGAFEPSRLRAWGLAKTRYGAVL